MILADHLNILTVKVRRFWLLALGFLALLAAAGAFFSYRTIHLEVDGERSTIQAFAWSVEEALGASRIPLLAEDEVSLVSSSWLKREMSLQIWRAARVIVVADGGQQVLLSASRSPAALLAQAGIDLRQGDLVLADGAVVDPAAPLPAYGEARQAPLIEVRRRVTFSVAEAGSTQVLQSVAPTLGQALWEHGVVIHAADRITPTLDTPLTEGLEVSLLRARMVMIATQGITLTLPSAAGSVGEALALAGLAPQELDYTIPAEHEALPANGLIHLVRVREEVIIEQSPLPFETSYQPAPEVELDNQVVVQAGEAGITARRIRVRYEDGMEVSRSTEAEWVARQPQERILGYGTMIVQRTANTDDGPITYWRALQMYAVSYHPGETGGNITASGLEVRKGLAAVDPRIIPLGTQMYVPGYGPALAADTGGGVIGRIIDLAYPTEDYVAWHEYVTVYFLWPPPENIVWVIP